MVRSPSAQLDCSIPDAPATGRGRCGQTLPTGRSSPTGAQPGRYVTASGVANVNRGCANIQFNISCIGHSTHQVVARDRG